MYIEHCRCVIAPDSVIFVVSMGVGTGQTGQEHEYQQQRHRANGMLRATFMLFLEKPNNYNKPITVLGIWFSNSF